MRNSVALYLGGPPSLRRRGAYGPPSPTSGVGYLLGYGGIISFSRVSLVLARVRAAFVLPSGYTPVLIAGYRPE